MVLKSKRDKQSAVRHLKNKKFQANCNLRKIRKQFGQRNHRRTAQRQRAKRFCRTVRNLFSKSIVSHETIECLPNVQGICRMKNRLGHLCGAQKQKVF